MYAVIESGGKQYRVELGSEIQVDRMDVHPGDSITLDRVLLVADGEDTAVGRPVVDGAAVSAKVLGQDRGDKMIVFKYKPKARRRVKKGFRAELTTLRISDITFGGRSAAEEERTSEERASRTAREAEKAAAEKAAADRELAARLAAAGRADATEDKAGSGTAAPKPKSRSRSGTTVKPSAPEDEATAAPKTSRKRAPKADGGSADADAAPHKAAVSDAAQSTAAAEATVEPDAGPAVEGGAPETEAEQASTPPGPSDDTTTDDTKKDD